MITVYLDITAPLYWWKEFDTYETYKVDTVANSCSTMHKIADKEFTLDDFSHEHLIAREKPLAESVDAPEPPNAIWLIHRTIQTLNQYRNLYLQTKDKKYWWQLIQLLPSSYNQRRTVMLNYEVLANIYKSRSSHKLDEWRAFCKCIDSLPYWMLITGPSSKDIKCNVILPSNDMIVGNTTPFDTTPLTAEEAIKLLHPATTAEALAEIECYGGFNGKQAKVEAVNTACLVACEALEKQIPQKPRETRCALMCARCGHKITEKGCKKLYRNYCKKCGQRISWEDEE